METIVERARGIADEVLFPSAMQTDAADLLPMANLDVLAREGFYGMAGPTDAGGLDMSQLTNGGMNLGPMPARITRAVPPSLVP